MYDEALQRRNRELEEEFYYAQVKITSEKGNYVRLQNMVILTSFLIWNILLTLIVQCISIDTTFGTFTLSEEFKSIIQIINIVVAVLLGQKVYKNFKYLNWVSKVLKSANMRMVNGFDRVC